MKINDIITEANQSADLDSLKWFPVDEPELPSYYPVRYAIMKAIGATHYANWGKIGAPWSDEMIGGSGTYMIRGPFGHVLLDASADVRNKFILLSQVSVENRGSGIGNKIMNAIKSHADSRGFGVQVVKVTARDFFDKFKWLTPDKYKSTYTYEPSKQVTEEYEWEQEEGYDFENPLPIIDDPDIWDEIEDLEYDIRQAWEEETGKSWRETYGKVPGGFKRFMKEVSVTENVPISKIICTEKWLSKDHIQRILSGESTKDSLPLIHDVDGQYFATDGNHRIVAAALNGEKSIQCDVIHPPHTN